MNTFRLSLAAAALAGVTLLSGVVFAQAPQNIGVAASVVNRMEGTVAAQKRVIGGGDKVFRDEVVETGADGKGQLLFLDETSLTVGPNSRVTLDRFVYNPNGQSTVVMTATRGVFRFVSGSLPSQAYEIKTPAGSIGVRGTIFQLILLPNGMATLHLLEGGVVWDTLLFGQIVLNKPGQNVTLPPTDGGRPKILDSLPEQLARLLDPIVNFGPIVKAAPLDGKNQVDEIRDQTRPSRGTVYNND